MDLSRVRIYVNVYLKSKRVGVARRQQNEVGTIKTGT